MKTKCHMGRCASSLPTFMITTNYINKNGEHPEHASVIYYNKIVFKKEDLNDNNWLYIGDATEKEKENHFNGMKECEGFIWVSN